MLTMLALLATTGCTEQIRAKSFGGEMAVKLPCGKRLYDVTWKKANLWYAVRDLRPTEKPETYQFVEESGFGVVEGTVVFTESRCRK
jgi:hypothetical protein